MSLSELFYKESLYPFQDGILKIAADSEIPFYLTGGTALSRFYFNHRYSDDLDFFFKGTAEFDRFLRQFYSLLEKNEQYGFFSINRQNFRKSVDYAQIILEKPAETGKIYLKIDIVNDTVPHYGELLSHVLFPRIDSVENILSNKVTAVYRYEAKDLADIVYISRNRCFDWKSVFNQAQSKDAGVDPVNISEILLSSPENVFDTVKWVYPPDFNKLKNDLKLIAGDIFYARKNSVFSD